MLHIASTKPKILYLMVTVTIIILKVKIGNWISRVPFLKSNCITNLKLVGFGLPLLIIASTNFSVRLRDIKDTYCSNNLNVKYWEFLIWGEASLIEICLFRTSKDWITRTSLYWRIYPKLMMVYIFVLLIIPKDISLGMPGKLFFYLASIYQWSLCLSILSICLWTYLIDYLFFYIFFSIFCIL